jgi:acyl-coenzyme A synthetase/AMP-(fatty) acid ligase
VVVYENAPGDKRLVAYAVKEPEFSPDSDELRKFQKNCQITCFLAAFMLVDALPRTPNGKLDRDALPVRISRDCCHKMYEAPADRG